MHKSNDVKEAIEKLSKWAEEWSAHYYSEYNKAVETQVCMRVRLFDR